MLRSREYRLRFRLSGFCAGRSPAAAAGGFDANSFAALQMQAAFAGQNFSRTVGANDGGAARCSSAATSESIRAGLTAVGEQSHGGVGEQLQFAHDAIATAMFAVPSTA